MEKVQNFIFQYRQLGKPVGDDMNKKIRILVVDDDPDINFATRRVLTQAGYEVAGVATGSEGVEFTKINKPGLVLLDIVLPDINGFEVCKQIKAEQELEGTYIIMLSGERISSEDKAVGLDTGADGYIVRPISNRELVARVQAMLRLQQAEEALKKARAELERRVEERTVELIVANKQLATEIEERKRAEEELRESEHYYRSLLHNMHEEILVIDRDYRITDVNNLFMRTLGRQREDVIGRHCYEVSHELDAPCNTYGEDCMLKKVFETGQPYSSCHEHLRVDGSKVWVDILLSPLKNDKGNVTHVIEAVRDVTDQKQAEEALLQSEEKYRFLVENANDAIFIAQDDMIKFPNPRAEDLTGYSVEELTKIPFADLIHPEDREMVLNRHRRRLKGESPPSTYSFRIITKNGENLWAQINTAPITWEKRKATLNFLRDVTLERKLKSQLIQSQKMEAIGTLAGGIAHDFNNILMAIMGYAEMTGMAIPKESEAHQMLGQVLKAGHRAKDLVKQILGFSRQSKEEKIPTKVSLIVKEVLKLLRASLPSTIEIRHEINVGNDTVMADPIQIHQVLMNLCTNAHHAMSKNGGVLEVGLSNVELDSKNASQYPELLPGSYVKLTVNDTGCGMDQNTLEKIFDPYFTTKEKGVGTGMGLAVVHGIIKNNEGAITVKSEPGKGSTFQILLPLVERELKSATEAMELCPSGNERVLFVDDEEPIMELGKRMLEHLGYDVVALTSSMEALAVFREKPDEFDLVVTDQTMPGLTGEMLTKEILGLRSDIPVILCTGFSEHIAEEQARAIGIKAFLMKPLLLKDIAQTVRKVLDE